MCGIAGLAGTRSGAAANEAIVRSMCDRIVHRGPDDSGVFASDEASIGMRRLSIIDLASGHQPIHNEDSTVWLVFNGEIYNYRELRAQLESLGHTFYTNSDSEVIVHAYEHYGHQCFALLRGMFAIAIWDTRERRLLLARDRFGKKPLFYTLSTDGSIAFGSELKTLLALPDFRPDLDPAAVRDYLLMGYVPTPRSIFRNVRKLEPGHWLSFDAGGVRSGAYWTLEFLPKWEGSEADLADRLSHEVEEAVRVRLISDVPFGAFLSGGLDSSVVTAFMARHLHEPVRTFTIGFKEAGYDESADARLVAAHIGARHEELIVSADAVGLLDRIVRFLDEPFGDSSAIPTYLVAELAARHVKMVLSGDGGDEIFGGYSRYGRYLRLLQLQRGGASLLAPVLALAGDLRGGTLGRRARSLAARLRQRFPASYLSGVALMNPQSAEELLAGSSRDGASGYGDVQGRFDPRPAGIGDLDSIIRGDIGSYLLDDILVKVDRMTMAHSLEARAPLLDHQLAGFAARLPESMKWRGDQGKRLFRQVAARVLPKQILEKRKQGFAIPLAEWFRGPLHDMLTARIADPRMRSGALNYDRVKALADQHRYGGVDHAETLWLALNLELWWQNCVLGGRP